MNKIISTEKENISQLSVNIDPLQKYKKLYFILGAIGAITLLITSFNIVAVLIGAAFGAGIAWFIIELISTVQTTKLDFKSYSLSSNITEEQLLEYLKNNFSHPEIKIDKGFLGIKFIFRESSVHTVRLNTEKTKYSISSTATAKTRLKNGGKVRCTKLYRNVVQVTPIIRQAIDEAVFSINKTN